MEFLALILAIVAAVLFAVEASRSHPWSLGWVGFACLTVALIIWHTFGGLEPIFD